MDAERKPMLAAYNEPHPTPEVLEKIADLLDAATSTVLPQGEPLPTADRDALLKKARQSQTSGR